MKKNIIILLILLLGGALRAQTPMAISNGSFEQWSSHPGYSVTVLFIPVSIYDTFSTPTSWDYPSYHVNQTVSLMGMNVNINTDIPLIKSTRESGSVPDGNKAVKLQTFMLSDIVNSTVLSIAASNLDTSLTNQVIPSILSTGAVNIDSFIPLLSNLMSGSGDLVSLLPTLLAEDVNDYITGGIALGDFRPGRLTGSYKYHSAVSGDNGGVVLIGTHYNNVTHKRDVVGGGLNIGLVDATTYTPFEVEYFPLSDLMPGTADVDPDSLIVLLISSASENRQQGSYLCLDNLTLWSAPDTCAAITAFSALPAIHEAQLSWSVTDPADGFELEYGPAGFALGSGTTATASTTSHTLSGLLAGTTYDVHLRTLCSDTIYGDWRSLQFSTYSDTCASVLSLALENQAGYDAYPEMVLVWNGSSQPAHWEVEYGPQGFQHGSGTLVETTETRFAIYALENAGSLSPNTWYDFYVRSSCGESLYGEWDSVHYLTPCATVGNATVNGENSAVTADNRISGYSLSWVDTTDTEHWGLYYGIYNPELPDSWGTYVTVDTPWFEFPPLQPERTYSVEISALCGEDNYGDILLVNFTTPALQGIDETASLDAPLTLYPNPAHGRCTVTLPCPASLATLQLYTLDGRLLETFQTDGSSFTLELPTSGLFLLRVVTPDGTFTGKIVNR